MFCNEIVHGTEVRRRNWESEDPEKKAPAGALQPVRSDTENKTETWNIGHYDLKTIGKNLRICRLYYGFSVEDIRRFLRLGSVQSVYQYEKGTTAPRAESLLAMMELYRIGPEDLRSPDFPGPGEKPVLREHGAGTENHRFPRYILCDENFQEDALCDAGRGSYLLSPRAKTV